VCRLSDDIVDRFKQLLVDHPGPSPVFVHLGETVLRLPEEFAVDATNGLLAETRVLLGPGAIRS